MMVGGVVELIWGERVTPDTGVVEILFKILGIVGVEITADGVEGGAVGKRLSLVVVGLTMGLETGNPDNVVSVGLKVVPVGEALRLLIQIIIIPATTRARTISDRIIKRRLFMFIL